MERLLGRFAPQLYALMRIVVGLLLACHGAQKLFGLLGGQQMPLVSKFGLAGVIEFFGGLMIALGFLTSPFHCQRRNGIRVLHHALAQGERAYPKWRRARGAVLLRVPLHRRQGRGRLGNR